MTRFEETLALLRSLVATPSFSREEELTADIWEQWLALRVSGETFRHRNNVFAVAPGFRSDRPTLLLNSHHDTVKPSPSYTRNPFDPAVEEDRLYGLGSNDAGASGVSLASAFIELMDDSSLPVNLILAITAEEEVMGENGMRSVLPLLREKNLYPDMAMVGEPTGLQPAVAERGLLVLDGEAVGKAGHAARNEGVNALYRAIDDIEILRNFKADKVSDTLGPLKVSVTMIQAGTQHNVVPDRCRFVVDVRTTDAYTNEETAEMLQKAVKHSTLTPRSTRVRASVIDRSHPLVAAAESLGKKPFVSPTTSDMALMHDFPSLKIGPGESARSHGADEYILLSELREALDFYPKLIRGIRI